MILFLLPILLGVSPAFMAGCFLVLLAGILAGYALAQIMWEWADAKQGL